MVRNRAVHRKHRGSNVRVFFRNPRGEKRRKREKAREKGMKERRKREGKEKKEEKEERRRKRRKKVPMSAHFGSRTHPRGYIDTAQYESVLLPK